MSEKTKNELIAKSVLIEKVPLNKSGRVDLTFLYEILLMGKKSKKCSPTRRILWYAFGSVGLAARSLTAITLLFIAIKIHPLAKEASSFNNCVEEIRSSGKNNSSSVNFCNGGS